MACPDLLLSQSVQTDITFDDTDKKYLPLEKVYFHILGKLHEALFDLKKWDCSFDKDKGFRNEEPVQEAESPYSRRSIIRHASRANSISSPEYSTRAATPPDTLKAATPSPTMPTQLSPTLPSPPVQIPSFMPQSYFKRSPDNYGTHNIDFKRSPGIDATDKYPIDILPLSAPLSNLLPLSFSTPISSPMSNPMFPNVHNMQPATSLVSAFSLPQKPPFIPAYSTANPTIPVEVASGAQYEELDSLRAALSKALSKSEFSPDLTNELCNLAATLKPGDMNNQALSQDLLRANLLQMSMAQNICPIMSTSRPKSEKKRQQIPADYQMLDEALTNNTSTEDVKTVEMDTSSDSKEKFHQCPYCEAKFNQKSNLKTHVFGVHHFKLSTCRTCKIITSKAKLHEHMKTHPNRGFKCEQCNTSFDTQIRLLRHMKIHSSERPYKCTYCLKSFVYKWNLTEHIRIHTGEKPFVCRLCGKGFCQSSTLKRHSLAMHTTEKPYKCSQCDESFVRILLLKKHFVNKHLNTSAESTAPAEPAPASPDPVSMLHMMGANNTPNM